MLTELAKCLESVCSLTVAPFSFAIEDWRALRTSYLRGTAKRDRKPIQKGETRRLRRHDALVGSVSEPPVRTLRVHLAVKGLHIKSALALIEKGL